MIANPTALHLEAALLGCRNWMRHLAGKADIALDQWSGSPAGGRCRRPGARVLVGFQFRFHPSLVRAQQLLSSGELGQIMTAHVHYGEYLPAWHPWEDYRQGYAARADLGGGVLLTQCHSLDYLPWLVGEVEAVWGFLAKSSDLEVDVDDTAEIGLRFTGGALATLHLDYAQQPPSHQLHISGTRRLSAVRPALRVGAGISRRDDRRGPTTPLPEAGSAM